MCTNISIQATNGDVFWGRTMDFTFDPFKASVNSQITAYPVGSQLTGLTETWASKYAFMGISMNNSLFFYDGMNSAGVVGDAQYLEECSWASAASLQQRGLKPLIGEEIVAYVLSHFGSVAEIKTAFQSVGLLQSQYPAWEQAQTGITGPVPMHYTFSDSSGASVILEPVKNGAFKIYDGIGVMTNSPEYPWHVDNLRNYLQLTNHNLGQNKLSDKLQVNQIESGSGLLGLPGDYTAPSRFVRGTYLANFLDPFTADQGITQLYNLFKTVMIPKGIEHVTETSPNSDYTGYWIGYDVKQQTLYLQPEDTPTLTQFTLPTNLTDKINLPINHEFKAVRAE